jgi:cytidylate kinase
MTADYGNVKADMAQRDRQDMERLIAPLRKPAGAITVDSTGIPPAAVVDIILDAVEQARCCTRS